MNLRPIQKDCIEAIFTSFKAGGTYHLVQASVAFGKTVIASELMRTSKVNYGAKCLFLAHLQELVVQTVDKFNRVAPDLSCGVFMGREVNVDAVIVGTRQTVSKHLDKIGFVNLIIIDEVHTYCEQYQKIVDYFLEKNPRLRVLGVTGTPFNQKGWLYGDGKLWPDPCFVAYIDQMIELNYLSKYRYKMANGMEELAGVKVAKGEFNESQMEELLIEERHMGSVKHAIEIHCFDRKKIMVFCVTIEHAEQLAVFLGVNCVHSKIEKKEWRKRVDDFKDGKDRILVNVSQLTVGFDCPEVDCLIVARPTMSPSLHVQICGRGLRVADDKTDCLIVDMVGNYLRHGLPSNPKVRGPKEQQEKKERKEKQANVCHMCFEVVEVEEVCPHCGAELTDKKEINEINEKIKLVEIEAERDSHRMIRWGEKPTTTKQGNVGVRFWATVTNRKNPVFRFCGHSSARLEKTREMLRSISAGDVVNIVASAYGDFIIEAATRKQRANSNCQKAAP